MEHEAVQVRPCRWGARAGLPASAALDSESVARPLLAQTFFRFFCPPAAAAAAVAAAVAVAAVAVAAAAAAAVIYTPR